MTAPALPRKTLGGLAVPPLALGSWNTWDRMDPDDAVAMIRRAADLDAGFFDVAYYNMGPHAENSRTDILFGQALRESGVGRDEIDDRLHMLRNRGGIGDQTVGHYDRTQLRYERQESVKGDAGGHQRRIVIGIHHVNALEDRLPRRPGMVPGRVRFVTRDRGGVDFRYGFGHWLLALPLRRSTIGRGARST